MENIFLDQLQSPVLSINDQNDIEYFNHICTTFFKIPPRKIKGKSLSSLIDSSYDLADMAAQLRLSKDVSISPEIDITVKETQKSYTVVLKMIWAKDQILVNFLDLSIEKQLFEKYKRQITELRETHSQILMSDRVTALGELTAGIGHEIANPLTIINAKLEDVDEAIGLEDIDAIDTNFKSIKSGIERISSIISNLNSYITDRDQDVLSLCSYKKVINESIQFVAELNLSNGVEISFDNKLDFIFTGNDLKIQQVIINLLKNSIDALVASSVKNPKIEIKLFEDTDTSSIWLDVIDNGPGIKSGSSEQIFEMFFTTKELGEGTGLGLAISQKIIQAHHGELSLLDSSVGAHFRIELPFSELETFSLTNRYLNGLCDYEDKKVLVLGDDLNLLNDLYKHLNGMTITTIISGNKDYSKNVEFFEVDFIINLFGKVSVQFDGKVYSSNDIFKNGNAIDPLKLDSILAKFKGHHDQEI